MDIIDVMLARAITPQGQIESYATQSQAAVARANTAVSAIESITTQTNTNNEQAAEALENANAALEQVTSALNLLEESSVDTINDEIDKLAYTLSRRANANVIATDMVVSNPSGQANTIADLYKMYKQTGANEDGTMTQKAITDALALKANAADTVSKTYVDNAIAAIPASGGGNGTPTGVSNLGVDAAGRIVIVGEDGQIKAGDAYEEALIKALIKSGTYSAEGTIGLTIDYENKSFERTQDAATRRPGSDFNGYAMYGGRTRCNVADDGTILAFYGDIGYREDGSNGQVMIYQPKFYYQRTVIKETNSSRGTMIRKESLLLSDEPRSGFKLAPLFQSEDEELDYVLLPAYEGSIYDTRANTYLLNNEAGVNPTDDLICSIAGAKPFNGLNNTLTLAQVKQMARNRGAGWQLTTMEAESALQMLECVEYGTPNLQNAIERGVVNISRNNGADCAAITGSTSFLGNATGAASSTIVDNNGARNTYTTAGSRAISYRGMENPWGNVWRLIANMTVVGSGNNAGGIPFYNGAYSLSYSLPYASANWVSAFGYDEPYDWVFLPIECDSNANSAVPIGDSLWTSSSLNGENLIGVGGLCNSVDNAGPFHYSADMNVNAELRYFNGRIMFVPTKNAIYDANIAKWRAHYGG